ncbi:Helicase PriA essential for oriC/DnaA-independent DNA replication [Candidatus Syntrophocurvum alkaliphilum]|uniref:Replication restart protein PriA n=1 Tax=Candidatus Syntrophocurvum alkaliphilum TaxID=2293317 RepID=A0A6I6DBD9_9FIRM|nr:primosomal protein N' [Candidatus Syntrophocurvum alkaliphilum]QGT99619.1 Helicase PriA essential for oriC/DnaA-independent DNA replication [Candidatus Syntrophocurvum alkaliphilum]
MDTYAKILLKLPYRLDHPYIYSIPEKINEVNLTGKRALVEFGNQKIEGIIVETFKSLSKSLEFKNIKPIIKVLDIDPVITPELLNLTYWMSDKYNCSFYRVVNTMIPKLLSSKRNNVIIPLISESELDLNTFETSVQIFLKELLSKGEVSINYARKHLSTYQLNALISRGLINFSTTYKTTKWQRQGYIYEISEFDYEDLDVLRKKAYRQAEAMEIIYKNKSIKKEKLEKLIPRNSIKSLLQKGYIRLTKQQNTVKNPNIKLTTEQTNAIEHINKYINQKTFIEFLVYGITGSGKTEIYIQSAQKAINDGLGVIVLVPEIALTRHLVESFSTRIAKMAVVHSQMSDGERYDEWQRIKNGEVDLVLGTRSAIFAPIPKLGLIIVDEEQETSYKQEETPKYHAREVARKRAEMSNSILILGSATPSIETFYKAIKGDTKLLTLNKRVKGANLPTISVVDLKKSREKGYTIFSDYLEEKIKHVLYKGEQVILFLNRRGYSPYVICTNCGKVTNCPNCSVSITYHLKDDKYICHYCNYQISPGITCSNCGLQKINYTGLGTQKIEEEALKLFPNASIQRLDIDISKRKGIQEEIINNMKKKQIDILIGTQMVAKGFDFPNVSLVGIINADTMLNIPDFRAAERCVQLILQAAGRAGRANVSGEVIIQTFDTSNKIIEIFANQDYFEFYTEEIKMRNLLEYPPFTNILRIVVTGLNSEIVKEKVDYIKNYLEEIIDASEENITILGPAPCPLYKLKNKYRYQIIIKSPNEPFLNSIVKNLSYDLPSDNEKIEIDINPLIFM